MILRTKGSHTREISLGSLKVGGNNPISVQTMLTLPLQSTDKIITQINKLLHLGCDVVRLAVRDMQEIKYLSTIVNESVLPVVADIQFSIDHAFESIKAGAQGIRINPGYIHNTKKLKELLSLAADYNTVIRIGFNSGSLSKDILNSIAAGKERKTAIIDWVNRWIELLDSSSYTQYKFSIKSSSPAETIELNRELSKISDAPIHLGVTEAGDLIRSSVRSAYALGRLISEGIGDTIRISVTGRPEDEIFIANELLRTLGVKKEGINLISCPTCSRCSVNLLELVREVSEKTMHIKKPLTVAIMGCPVNGPGEAKHADIGLACSDDSNFILFKNGSKLASLDKSEAVKTLLCEIENVTQ